VIGSRIPVLNENIVKWGNPDVIITNNDPSAFTQLENLFDVILIDAPCSGEGLFRKDPSALEEWSETNCDINAARQKRILTSLLPALKPGGILMYSTCTFNPEENEKTVRWILNNFEMESLPVKINDDWGIKKINTGRIDGYAFLPHKVKGEGLFISVLRKKNETTTSVSLKTKSLPFSPLQKKFSTLKDWIHDPENNFSLMQKEEMVFAVREEWIPTINFLSGMLRITHSGCHVADFKGDKAIPSHELAVNTLLNKNAFPSVELKKDDALKFLRREDFKIEAKEKGYTLVAYSGFPLGWINFLGNRFNNYYPVNWRIRMK